MKKIGLFCKINFLCLFYLYKCLAQEQKYIFTKEENIENFKTKLSLIKRNFYSENEVSSDDIRKYNKIEKKIKYKMHITKEEESFYNLISKKEKYVSLLETCFNILEQNSFMKNAPKDSKWGSDVIEKILLKGKKKEDRLVTKITDPMKNLFSKIVAASKFIHSNDLSIVYQKYHYYQKMIN